MIERIRIRNYKALRDVAVELGRINVLVGPNDSGKTSFLEAIGAICRSVDVPLEQAFVGAWSGADLVSERRSSSCVSLTAEFCAPASIKSYGFECRFSAGSRHVRVASEKYTDWDDRLCELGESSITTGVRAILGISPPHPEIDAATRLRELLSGVRHYRLDPESIALPVGFVADERFSMVDAGGFGLAVCLDDIITHDVDRFVAIRDSMRRAFPELQAIRLVREPAVVRRSAPGRERWDAASAPGKALRFALRNCDGDVPASQVSDGMLLVLAYLTILSTPTPPRLLLIEEPENGIHPRRLKEVLSVVRDFVREQSETQVILTSHSPYVVDLFDPSEVYACRKDPEAGVAIQRLSESPLVQDQIRHFTLGEIWVSEGEDRLVAPAARVLKLADQVAEDGPTAP